MRAISRPTAGRREPASASPAWRAAPWSRSTSWPSANLGGAVSAYRSRQAGQQDHGDERGGAGDEGEPKRAGRAEIAQHGGDNRRGRRRDDALRQGKPAHIGAELAAAEQG